MKGVRYFFSILLGIAALSLGAWFAYTRVGHGTITFAEALDSTAAVIIAPYVDLAAGRSGTDGSGSSADSASATAESAPAPSPVATERVPATSSAPAATTTRPTVLTSVASADSTPPVAASVTTAGSGAVGSNIGASGPVNPVPAWRASPRSVVRDSAYVMTESGRIESAIVVLNDWARENPSDTAVLADLARLLSRSGRHDEARARFSQLVALDSSTAFILEAATAHANASDFSGTAQLLARALERTPGDTALRRRYAQALELSSASVRAAQQYSILLDDDRTAELLYERGRLRLWSGDADRGADDLRASNALSPRADAQRLLGDYHRWRGELAKSRAWYREAQRSAPNDSSVLAGMELLDRAIAERLRQPGELDANSSGSTVRATSDNSGYRLYSLGAGHAWPLPVPGTTFSLGGEMRTAQRARTPSDESAGVRGYGADAGISATFGLAKLSAAAGVLAHDSADRLLRMSFSADALFHSASLRLSVRRAPAYETLWSPRMLYLALDGTSWRSLATLSSSGSLTLPLAARSDLYLSGEHVRIGNSNERISFNGALSTPLAGRFSAVYAAGFMWFAESVADYYSPARYLSQSLGVRYSRYVERGLSIDARVLPGYAWMHASGSPIGATPSLAASESVFQLAAGLDLTLRRGSWDFVLSTALGSGREGGYRSGTGSLQLRRVW